MAKILIVDDNEDILDAIALLLDNEGHDVKTTINGQDTLSIVHDDKPDLILLDVLLSGCDGRDIASKLKSDDRTKSIPIIMISAHPSADKSIKECGANDFVSKPFDIHILLDKVAHFTTHLK